MKVRIEMMVEVSDDNAQDYDVQSHVQDALIGYTGNALEFWDIKVKYVRCGLKEFTKEIREVVCIESFEAVHTNVINRERVTTSKHFVEGVAYRVESWRPEGMWIDGFFVFNSYAGMFAEVY